MKTNIILLFVSTSLCLAAGLALFNLVILPAQAPTGAVFESVEDLRTQLNQRDERDVKSDKSVSFRSIVQADPSDAIIYSLRPNLNVKFQRVQLRTNSHGMRSAEVPIEKGDNVFRIALLGDSFGFGWGVEQDAIFANVIQRELNKSGIVNGKKVEVLNFAVPGYSTFQEVAQFLETGTKFDPDLVLVFFVDNDFGLPFLIKRFDGSDSLESSQRFNRRGKKVKDEQVIAKRRKFLGGINPNGHLKKLADEMKKVDVPVLLTINPRRSLAVDIKKLHILRSHDNLSYLPIKEGYLKIMKDRGLSRKDVTLSNDPHPNAMQHGIYAELIVDKMMPHLAKVSN